MATDNIDITITKLDEIYLQISFKDPEDRYLLREKFSFRVPGCNFMPSYKIGAWDGYIRLFNMFNGTIYVGLLDRIIMFAKSNNWRIKYNNCEPVVTDASGLPDIEMINTWIDGLSIPFEVRDYQINIFRHAIASKRKTFVSPTGSGKSLCIYLLARYLIAKHKKTLIVVPAVSLIKQMGSDLVGYAVDDDNFSKDDIHTISAGACKDTDCPVVISTWQSLTRQPKRWFDQFEAVIIDECHLAKAASIQKILENLPSCEYRFGFTGTLSNKGSKANIFVITGLLGPEYKAISTRQLMDRHDLADIEIFCCVFNYGDKEKKTISKLPYLEEKEYICAHAGRNAAIADLVLDLKGVTLVLFEYVEKHGHVLERIMGERFQGAKELHYIHGGVKADIREEVRQKIIGGSPDDSVVDDCVVLASYGVYSTGVNLPSLANIVLASPTKSYIRILQSLGRGLRTHEHKDKLRVIDCSDDFQWKTKMNTTLRHFEDRVALYSEQGFNYHTISVDISDSQQSESLHNL